MKILLVNDDGIGGFGLLSLAKKLSASNDVVIVAPQRECSGTSHAITFFKALNYKEEFTMFGFPAYSLDGTPVDCVKFGIDVLCKTPPDLIISGINNQLNIGTDVIYSGTVNAAFEGAIMGFKSIAVSAECETLNEFDFASDFVVNNLDTMINMIDAPSTILNINIPFNDRKLIKGVAITQLGIKRYNDRYELRELPDHSGYYLIGNPITVPENPVDCDVEMCNEGYITISPLTIQLTDYDNLNKFKTADFLV
jgi:5'-nucleotidase